MPSTASIVPVASAARTASGVGSAIDLVQRTTADLALIVTAIGTGSTLTVTIETSADGTIWRATEEPFLPADAITTLKQVFTGLDRWIRARWDLTSSGSPSATFAVAGDAVLVYATPEHLSRFGAAGNRFAGVPLYVQDIYLRVASDEADGSIQEEYGLPGLKWGDDLRNLVCSIAAWMILTKYIGTNAEAGADGEISKNSDRAYKRLAEIARGDANLVGYVDSTPSEDDGGVFIYSDPPRGWDR